MKVALFATCLMDRLMPDAALAAWRLLRSLGVDVDVPAGQTCCGQPAFNAGYRDEARQIAAHTLRLFAGNDSWVVLPSGSCAAMLRRHYADLLDSVDAAAATAMAGRTFELSEFIVQVLGITELGRGLAGKRIVYHHGCHGLRELGVREEPLTLLRNAGAELLPWEAAQECCGFGGLFAVKHPEVSAAMADRKIDTIPQASRPDVLTSADGGCLLQLAGRLKRRGMNLPARHLAEILLEAANGSS
jgi:L-lactate dehydrogenase complex protein LldE